MNTITFRPATDIPASLEKVAAMLDRPKSWVINEALRSYLATQAELAQAIQASLKFADEHPDQMVPHADAMARLRAKAKAGD
ncbi:MAG: hypothetical protein EBR40_06245 [Proteobacteria bacterium]|nr:hypothetical protein [Pseudomonadota bacterium]